MTDGLTTQSLSVAVTEDAHPLASDLRPLGHQTYHIRSSGMTDGLTTQSLSVAVIEDAHPPARVSDPSAIAARLITWRLSD